MKFHSHDLLSENHTVCKCVFLGLTVEVQTTTSGPANNHYALQEHPDPAAAPTYFPGVAADANGHVVVTWLGSYRAGNSNDVAAMQPTCTDGITNCWAQWSVYIAESVNGHVTIPSFAQRTASDHFIHAGTVCTNGTGCSSGDSRSLADFFQVALDTQHRANIAFADDHLASPLCSQQSPGHCANNDPLTFRAAVPYFTYQLKPNNHIVTTGICAR